jgi:dihydroneopterin aldolase
MNSSLTIELRGLRFFAGHGIYREEALTGNQFEVDLSLLTDSDVSTIESIGHTVNYVEVYSLVKEVFDQRTDLLETIVRRIIEQLQARFPSIISVTISVRKLHPPITGFSGSVGITYKKDFR